MLAAILVLASALSLQAADAPATQYRVGVIGSPNAEILFGGSTGFGARVAAFGAVDVDGKRWRLDVGLAARAPSSDYIASHGSLSIAWPTTIMGVDFEVGGGPALGVVLTRITDSAFPYMPMGLAGATGYGALGIPLTSWLALVAEARLDAFVPVPVPTVWLMASAGGGVAVRF